MRESTGEKKVTVWLDSGDKTIQIDDTGLGMTKKELETVFSDLGRSGKRDSAEASGGFGLAKAAGAEGFFLKLKHVCLSRDVAEPLQAIGATHVAIAETADEAALFRALRQALGEFASLGSSRV